VWFVNGNNYHVEHHWLPAVPNDKFPELHTYVSSRITYADLGYGSFYSQFFRNLRRNNLHQAWEPATLHFGPKNISVSAPEPLGEPAVANVSEAAEETLSARSSSASA